MNEYQALSASTNVQTDEQRHEDITSRTVGALLVWIGVVLLGSLGWGIGLIGGGVLLLVEQLWRWRLRTQFEWLWVGAAVVAIGLGLSRLGVLRDVWLPLALIVLGAGSVASTLVKRKNVG